MDTTPPGEISLNIREFEQCRNIVTGPVILLASGISARDFPLAEFAHVPVIAMNGSISLLRDAGRTAFFYACTDRDFPKQQPELFSLAINSSQRLAVWNDQLNPQQPPPGEVYLLKKAKNLSFVQTLFDKNQDLVRHRNSLDKRTRSIGFSRNLEQGFFDARTVAYLALQLAYHVGFTQVFLVGLDLNQSLGRFYEHGDMLRSPCGLDQHYHKRILPSLTLVADKVMGERFGVFNLSACSRVPAEIIPKIDLMTFRSMVKSGVA